MNRREALSLLLGGAASFFVNPRSVFAAENGGNAKTADPDEVRGLYVTNLVAADRGEAARQKRETILRMTEETEINSLVIDVVVDTPLFSERLEKFVAGLKKRNLHVIARIVVCQNHRLALKNPDIAIKRRDGSLWYAGKKEWRRHWIDPRAEKLWQFAAEMSRKAIDFGFDEVQYDYIRFPSDGDMSDIVYPIFKPGSSKRAAMREMFQFLAREVRSYNPKTKISIDIFGEGVLLGYAEKADKEVGQHIFDMADVFDYISPMVYPSHYRPGFLDLEIPARHPYDVVYRGLKAAAEYLWFNDCRAKLRPFLQDFGARNYLTSVYVPYDSSMVRAQIAAAEDLEIAGWILWNAGNVYSRKALQVKNPR